VNLYLRVLRWAGRQRWFAWFGRHVLTRIDTRLSNRAHSLTTFSTGLPMGYLTTTGHKSGKPRTVPLLFAQSAAGNPVVVGTNWGGTGHPLWVNNLEADPAARWRASDEVAVIARRIDGSDFTDMWRQFVTMWPGYESYVARSGRRPMMFELERVVGDRTSNS
jgi:deazaflavin-dependent oxidoreductase (nitroreductase family)